MVYLSFRCVFRASSYTSPFFRFGYSFYDNFFDFKEIFLKSGKNPCIRPQKIAKGEKIRQDLLSPAKYLILLSLQEEYHPPKIPL